MTISRRTQYTNMWLSLLWTYLKHFVLDLVHPLPPAVDLFQGAPGTVEHSIVRRVVSCTELPKLTIRAHGEDDEEDATGSRLPAVWPDGDFEAGGVPSTGCFAVSRYIGRLWRLYPVNPQNALAIDSSLDLLARFIADVDDCDQTEVRKHVRTYMKILERRMSVHDEDWMENMSSQSLADLAWAGAFEWASQSDDLFAEGSDMEFPRMGLWWEMMCV